MSVPDSPKQSNDPIADGHLDDYEHLSGIQDYVGDLQLEIDEELEEHPFMDDFHSADDGWVGIRPLDGETKIDAHRRTLLHGLHVPVYQWAILVIGSLAFAILFYIADS